jgi:hypothetical protein
MAEFCPFRLGPVKKRKPKSKSCDSRHRRDVDGDVRFMSKRWTLQLAHRDLEFRNAHLQLRLPGGERAHLGYPSLELSSGGRRRPRPWESAWIFLPDHSSSLASACGLWFGWQHIAYFTLLAHSLWGISQELGSWQTLIWFFWQILELNLILLTPSDQK